MWHVQTEDGQQYGPISKAELDGWVAEQRVTSQCQLLQQGGAQWQWADEVYPSLRAEMAGAPAAGNEFFIDTGGSGGDGDYANPYAAPRSSGTSGTYGSSSTRRLKPHRATLVLTMALMGWAVCIGFAPVAWYMAAQDLADMKRGRMDRRGYSTTQVAMIISIVQVILGGFSILAVVILAAAGKVAIGR
jgi:hypothetical protein